MNGRATVLVRLLLLLTVATLACASCTQQFAFGIDGQPVRCLPWTLYLLQHSTVPPRRDAFVAFRARGLAPQIADGRLLVKQAAGLPGDRIEVRGGRLRINGIERARLDPAILARIGRSPASLEREAVLAADEYLLLGRHPLSYDSRYFGPVTAAQLIGEATPLW